MAPFIKIVPKGYVDDLVEKDPQILPWQGYNVLPVPAVRQLGQLQDMVRRQLAGVTQPVRIFQGALDHTIDPRSAEIIKDEIGSKDKELIHLDHSGHCILLDRQLPEVKTKTARFLQSIMPVEIPTIESNPGGLRL